MVWKKRSTDTVRPTNIPIELPSFQRWWYIINLFFNFKALIKILDSLTTDESNGSSPDSKCLDSIDSILIDSVKYLNRMYGIVFNFIDFFVNLSVWIVHCFRKSPTKFIWLDSSRGIDRHTEYMSFCGLESVSMSKLYGKKCLQSTKFYGYSIELLIGSNRYSFGYFFKRNNFPISSFIELHFPIILFILVHRLLFHYENFKNIFRELLLNFLLFICRNFV